MTDKKIPRRTFMRMLPMAPVAAKEAATQAAAQASGVSIVGRGGMRRHHYPGPDSSSKIERHIFGLLRDGKKIPELRTRGWWRTAKADARVLDPDISSMRSLSLSKKMGMQAERNYERQVQEYMDGHLAGNAWRAFTKGLGINPDDDDDAW